MTGLAVASAATPALADNWKITPSIGVTETFTDNVDLATESGNRRADLVSTITPGLQVRGTGARVQAGLDLQTQYRHYLESDNQNRDNLLPNISGFGRVELWEDQFFVDARIGVSRVTTDPRAIGFESPATRDIGTSEVRSLSLSPQFIQRFGTFARLNASATYGYVDTDNGALGSSNTLTENVQLSSGTRFNEYLWNVTAFHTETTRDGGIGSTEESRATVDGTYLVTEQIAANGSIGWQIVDDNTLVGDNDGLTWSVGGTVRPSPRTSARASYGRQYASNSLSFSGTYSPTSRTQLTADYFETLQTSQQLVLQDLLFLGVSQTGVLIDTRTGLPFDFSGQLFGFQSLAFRQRRFSGSASTTQGRNTFRVNSYVETRETELTAVEQTVYGLGASFGRTLSTRASGNVGLTLARTDYGTADDRQDDLIAFQAGLSYFLFRDVQANLSYIHTERLSSVSGADITENAVSVSLSKSF